MSIMPALARVPGPARSVRKTRSGSNHPFLQPSRSSRRVAHTPLDLGTPPAATGQNRDDRTHPQ